TDHRDRLVVGKPRQLDSQRAEPFAQRVDHMRLSLGGDCRAPLTDRLVVGVGGTAEDRGVVVSSRIEGQGALGRTQREVLRYDPDAGPRQVPGEATDGLVLEPGWLAPRDPDRRIADRVE